MPKRKLNIAWLRGWQLPHWPDEKVRAFYNSSGAVVSGQPRKALAPLIPALRHQASARGTRSLQIRCFRQQIVTVFQFDQGLLRTSPRHDVSHSHGAARHSKLWPPLQLAVAGI